MSLLGRLRAGLRRTRERLTGGLSDLTADGDALGHRGADGETLAALEELLIEADVGVVATERIVSRVRDGNGDDLTLSARVRREILEIFDRPASPAIQPTPLRVVLVVGVNGTGKTTTVAKLAHRWRREGETPLICAADTFRAAAADQIETWARRAAVDIVRAGAGADPAAVVFDAIRAGQARGRSVVIVDTAGRLHTRRDLMAELNKIRRVTARAVDGAPHEVLLVLDATVGQNGLAQARQFLEASAVTGIVLAKLDGTAKGGVAVAVASELDVPIQYVGVGEGIEDLVPFSPADYVDALFVRG